MKSNSWFSDHPWMTFFIAGAVVHGVVTIVRGYEPPFRQLPQPRFDVPHVRGAYR